MILRVTVVDERDEKTEKKSDLTVCGGTEERKGEEDENDEGGESVG